MNCSGGLMERLVRMDCSGGLMDRMDCSGAAQIGMVDLAAFGTVLNQHTGSFP